MRRRSFLGYAALAPLASAQQSPAGGDELQMLELFRVHVNRRGHWLLARLTTNDGATGIGDASHGKTDDGVAAKLEALFQRLKKTGIWNIEAFRSQTLAEVEKEGLNAAVAFGALEQCCHDLQGKLLKRPVYDLFGGRLYDTIRNYANINRAAKSREPEAFGDLAARAVAAGFDAIKLASFDGMPKNDPARRRQHIDRGIECIEAVRKAAGPGVDIFVDGHSNFDLEGSLAVMRRLAPVNLAWLEEMSPRVEELAAFNQAATVATAGGESIFGIRGFYPYIKAGAVDIVMPDVKYCGGLLEMKKIAAMAEAAGLRCSPHGPASPVGNMAAAHACLTMPNFYILEMAFGETPWRAELITPAESLVKGRLQPSPKPGFGIELNESTLKQQNAAKQTYR